jgi:NaMN:DMB phosphoribosyltransferase
MDLGRVAGLFALGRRWGERLGKARSPRPLLLAECVPGGTTTAQAVLSGLGLAVEGLVGSSLRDPDLSLKARLVRQGLAAAGLGLASTQGEGPPHDADPLAVVAAVGDPMQPVAAGLVLAAAAQRLPVLLAGGSQMAAVLALALALAPASQREGLAAQVAIGTTAWVANDPSSNLGVLLQTLERQWGVTPLGLVADLRFQAPLHPALLDYERGFVKEGVGAGGLALAWQLSGRHPQDLARASDRACRLLLAEGDLGASTVPP